jgi:Fe-S cluster assembly protein SufD
MGFAKRSSVASLSTLTPAIAVTRDEHGTHVDIPAGLQSDEPVVINYDVADPAVVAHTFVTVGDGARASIIERLTGSAEREISVSTQITTGARSDVTYTVVQNLGAGVRIAGKRASRVGSESRVAWNVALLGGSSATDEVISDHTGEGANTEIAALFFPVAREVVQLTTEVQHNVPHTISQTVVRSIAAGRGRGRYYGNIRIAAHAHGSEASLRDDTLLIGKDAKIDAIPALEIAANDVKAFHGATVGAIDEEHIFYLMSRGIERDASEKLIALGFFEPAVSRFPGEALRDELRALLEEKLAGARR